MDPIAQAVFFGRADDLIREKNPNEEEQLPATQNDTIMTKHAWDDNPTEANGQAYVSALRRSGLHEEADTFAKLHLKNKPRFTISEM